MPFSSPYLTKHPVLFVLSVAPAVLAGVVLALSFQPGVYRRIERWRLPLTVAAYIVTRFVLFYVIYIALSNRDIGGDVRWFRWEGLGALAGKVPYRDFRCLHSPLFPYLMAVPYSLWNHIASGVLAFIAFDIICLLLLWALTRATLGTSRTMDIAWIYTINPAVWMITVRYGQDETVVCAFLLLAVYLYMRGSSWWNPVTLALGVLLSKLTTAVGMVVIYTYSRTKVRDALVAGALVVAVCLPFRLLGADVLSPLAQHSGWAMGVSVTSVISTLAIPDEYGGMTSRIGVLVTLMALGSVLYLCHRRRVPVLESVTACLMVFLIFVPVSYALYRMWFLGPLSLHVVKTGRVYRYAFYTVLLCVFNDFSFVRGMPHSILYPMAVLAVGILYLEFRYVFDILSREPAAKDPA